MKRPFEKIHLFCVFLISNEKKRWRSNEKKKKKSSSRLNDLEVKAGDEQCKQEAKEREREKRDV